MAMNDLHVRAIDYPIPKALVATRALTSLPKNLQRHSNCAWAEIESGPQIEERVQRRETTQVGGA